MAGLKVGRLKAEGIDRHYVTEDQAAQCLHEAETCSRQLRRFAEYQETHPSRRLIKEDMALYDV